MKKCIYFLFIMILIGCGKDLDETTVIETSDVNLVGFITNEDGAKIDNGIIELYNDDELLKEFVSDKSGNFTIEMPSISTENSRLYIKVTKEGYSTSYRSVDQCSIGSDIFHVALSNAENLKNTNNGNPSINNAVRVSGRVIDEFGNAGRVRAIIFINFNEDFNSALVDQNGCYEFFAPKGSSIHMAFFTGCETNLMVYNENDPFQFFHVSETSPIIIEEDIIIDDVISQGEYQSFNINGTFTDCDGRPIEQGEIVFNEFYRFEIFDGIIDYTRTECFPIPDQLEYIIYDGCNGKRSEVTQVQSAQNNLDIGSNQVCIEENPFMQMTFGDQTYQFCQQFGFTNQQQFAGGDKYKLFGSDETDRYSFVMRIEPRVNGDYEITACSIFKDDNVISNAWQPQITIDIEEDIKSFGGLNKGSFSDTFIDPNSGMEVELSGTFAINTTNAHF